MIKKISIFVLLLFNILNADSFLSYVKTPNQVILNQLFEVKLKVIITDDDARGIETYFENSVGVQVLNESQKWNFVGSNTYENTFYYKIINEKFLLPQVSISYLRTNKEKLKSQALSPFRIKVISLKGDEFFCNVIAKEFKITADKTATFDATHNIIVLRIESNYANLEDMKLSFAIRDGINSKEYELPNIKVYYFAIVPKSLKSFKFNYFNLDNNRFEPIQVPIELSSDEVSTHFELNPNKNRFLIYKTVALISVASLFLLIFLFKRKVIFLLIVLIIGGYLAYNRHPLTNKNINLHTKVRILPTKNSTIFYVSTKPESVEILNMKDDYIKVLLPNKSVGWVLNEDFIKN